jgi:hypothetical protein
MRIIFIVFMYFSASLAHGFELNGMHDLVLSNGQGERVVVGKVSFTPLPDGRAEFLVTMSESLEEYFLAMRPFRCLTGPRQRLCHFPVAREPAIVSRDDLVPLEYALMFMRTAPGSLHVDAFNGIFYRLQVTGNSISGRLYELDMDPFITPDSIPMERRKRPVREQDLSLGDATGHWLPFLSIEATNAK